MPTRSQEMKDKQVRAQYTQEFKLEAVRQVRAGQAIAVVAKVLGIPKASLGNWVRLVASTPPSPLDATAPAPVKAAAMLLVGDLYANRESQTDRARCPRTRLLSAC